MSWWSRLRNAVYARPLDDSLEDEIQDHLERRAAAFRAEGLAPDDARRRALSAFGNVARVREQSREIRLWPGLESTIQDARYAWRTMRRNPAFTITAIMSLSLAIGANTAIYAIVDAVMLRPLPVPDASRVFTLAAPVLDAGAMAGADETESFSYPLYLHLRAAAGNSAHLAAFGPTDQAEVQGPDPTSPIVRARQQFVSGEAFEMLRVSPAAGRLFTRDDDRTPGVPRSAVLSFDYWRSHFSGDPNVVGRPLTLNGRPFQIIGVAPENFLGVEPGRAVDIWVPVMTFDPGVFSNPDASLFRIVGRLGDRTSPEQLQARLHAVYRDRQRAVIAQNPTLPAAVLTAFGERSIQVRPGGIGVSDFRRSFARPMWIVWSVAAAILLVACATVASLLLSRSASRSQEMLLRTSLGASRGRLVRQLLTESVMLAGLANGLGLAFASVASPLLVTTLSTNSEPVHLALTMDTRVLLFCAGICAATILIVGVLPAWHGSGARALSAVAPGRGEAHRLVLGRLFVSVQVAFVFCLVVAGAGFLFSLQNLFTIDMGFDPRHVTVLTMRSDFGPKQDGLKLTQQLQRQMSGLSNVQGAAVGWWAMFGDSRRAEQIVMDGKAPSERQETFYRVSPGYFATLATPLVEGRDFDVRDSDGVQPVPTIVNRAFARRYFGADAVVGREFRRRSDNARHVIIGVAADAYYSDLRSGLQPVVYFPMKPPRLFTLYIRSALDAASVRQLVEQQARITGPGMHVVEVTTLETLIGNTLLKEKLLAGVGGVFAALGLILVTIGLFGLLSYSVVRRTKELGIRAALGARRHTLIVLVLKELFVMMAGGLTAGILGSLGLMRLIHSQLFGLAAVDPLVIVTASATFLLTTSIAVVLPAYRVAIIDPLVALRQD
jgi:putative ABC transport system permease protein